MATDYIIQSKNGILTITTIGWTLTLDSSKLKEFINQADAIQASVPDATRSFHISASNVTGEIHRTYYDTYEITFKAGGATLTTEVTSQVLEEIMAELRNRR